MKKRFSVFALIVVSIFTAAIVAATVVWTGSMRNAHSVDITSASPTQDTMKASWAKVDPTSFADLAERVGKAVVNISTSKKAAGRRGIQSFPFPKFGPNDPFDDFFEKFFDGMPQEQVTRSLGSGFIINKDGTILTNNHVVSRADDIEVSLSDGRKFKAKVLGVDERTDIAVIKIDTKESLPAAKLGNSSVMRPGDWVMAIGNPFGLDHTVTVGVVSAIGRLIGGGAPYAKFIQTDASINPGNSGGPLFNLSGEVIGLNTMIHAGGQGIGFAIPIDLAKQMVPELVEKGSVSRGWLGVSIQEITPELAKSFNLEKNEGALVSEVYSDSPASKAGLVRGDIIIEFNGEKVEEPYDLSLHVGNSKPGSKINVVVLRKNEKKNITIEIGKYKEGEVAFAEKALEPGKADKLGLVVKSVSAEDARKLGVPANFKGVYVERVDPESSAAYANIATGDIILEINDSKIQSVEDYMKTVEKLKTGDPVRLFIKRGVASIYLAFKL